MSFHKVAVSGSQELVVVAALNSVELLYAYANETIIVQINMDSLAKSCTFFELLHELKIRADFRRNLDAP